MKNIILIIIINLLLAFTKYLIIIDCGAIINTIVGLVLSIVLDLLMSLAILKVLKRKDKNNRIKYYQLLLISVLITIIDYIIISI